MFITMGMATLLSIEKIIKIDSYSLGNNNTLIIKQIDYDFT